MNSQTHPSSNLPELAETSQENYKSEDPITSPQSFSSPKDKSLSYTSQNQMLNSDNKNPGVHQSQNRGEGDTIGDHQTSTMTYSSQFKCSPEKSLTFKPHESKDFAQDATLGTNFLSPNDTREINQPYEPTLEEVEQKVDENLRKIEDLEHLLNNQLNRFTSGRDSSNNSHIATARSLKSPDRSGNLTSKLRSPALRGTGALKKDIFLSPTIPRYNENYHGLRSDVIDPPKHIPGPNLNDKILGIADRFDPRSIDMGLALKNSGNINRPFTTRASDIYSPRPIDTFRSPDRTHSYKNSYDQVNSPNPYRNPMFSPNRDLGVLQSDRYGDRQPRAQWGISSHDPNTFYPGHKGKSPSNFGEILDSTRKILNEIKTGGSISQRSSQFPVSGRNSNQPKFYFPKREGHYSISHVQKSQGTDLSYSVTGDFAPSKTRSILEESKRLFTEIKDTFKGSPGAPGTGRVQSQSMPHGNSPRFENTQPTNQTELTGTSYVSPKGNAGQFNFDQSRSPQSMQYTKSPEPNPKSHFGYDDPLRNTVSSIQHMASPGFLSSVESEQIHKMGRGQSKGKNIPNEMISSTEQPNWQQKNQGRPYQVDQYYLPGVKEEEQSKKAHPKHYPENSRHSANDSRHTETFESEHIPRSEAIYKMNPYDSTGRYTDKDTEVKPYEGISDSGISKSNPSTKRPQYKQVESLYQLPESVPTDRESQPQNVSHVREKISPNQFNESMEDYAEEYHEKLKQLINEVQGQEYPPGDQSDRKEFYVNPSQETFKEAPRGLHIAPEERPAVKSSRSNSRSNESPDDIDSYPEIPIVTDEDTSKEISSSQQYESEEEHYRAENRPRKISNRDVPENNQLHHKPKVDTPERKYYTGELEQDVDSAVKPSKQKATKKTTKKKPVPVAQELVSLDLGSMKSAPVQREVALYDDEPIQEETEKKSAAPRKQKSEKVTTSQPQSTKSERVEIPELIISPNNIQFGKTENKPKQKLQDKAEGKQPTRVDAKPERAPENYYEPTNELTNEPKPIKKKESKEPKDKKSKGQTSSESSSSNPSKNISLYRASPQENYASGEYPEDLYADPRLQSITTPLEKQVTPRQPQEKQERHERQVRQERPERQEKQERPEKPEKTTKQSDKHDRKEPPSEKKQPSKQQYQQSQEPERKPFLKQESFSESSAIQENPIRFSPRKDNPLKQGHIRTADFNIPEYPEDMSPSKIHSLQSPSNDRITPQTSQVKLQLVSQPVKKKSSSKTQPGKTQPKTTTTKKK